ncbi:MAG: UTRA domain-containing protein [Niameybacter sp.]
MARQLGIALDDKVVCLKRLRMVNGIPENYQISYLNKELIKDIDFSKEDLNASFLFRLLREKAELVPKYSDEEIRAVICPLEIAQKLGVEKNDPVLFIRRTTYSQEGLVMEYCEDYECSDVKGLKVRTFA